MTLKRKKVGETIKNWVVSNFEVTENDVSVETLDYENYVTVSVIADWPGFESSDVRRAVEDNSSHSISDIPECTDTYVSVVPQ